MCSVSADRRHDRHKKTLQSGFAILFVISPDIKGEYPAYASIAFMAAAFRLSFGKYFLILFFRHLRHRYACESEYY